MFPLPNQIRTYYSIFSWLLFRSKTASSLLLATAFFGSRIASVNAQSIIEADDGIGTRVEQDQSVIGIEGGTQSGNNLFHSFERFGLSEGESAIFLSNPEIINILGRVVGNEASLIDGLIQVNGNANLFLMNPAGIIFGENAQLNVNADFTATTATGIGFGDGNFFNAFGGNDFSTLTGTPFEFAFDSSDPNGNPGAIVNLGDLATTGDITLVGGSVVSTGTISSSQGDITISTVSDSSLVKIEQEGNLLSLEIDPPRDVNGEILPFSAVDLPELLTGNILVNDISGENVTIQADDGNIFVGANQAFDSNSLLPELNLDGDILANSNISLTADEVFVTSDSTLAARNLTLQPNDLDRDINIGNQEETNAFDITVSEILVIDPEIESITIGNSNSTGTITVFDEAVENDRVKTFLNKISLPSEANSEVNFFSTEQSLNEATNDEIVGIDLDGDGIPDVPIGVNIGSQIVEPPEEEETTLSDEEQSQINRDVLNISKPETIENLQQLTETTIVFESRDKDPITVLNKEIRILDERFSRDYLDYYALNTLTSTSNESTSSESSDRTNNGNNIANYIFVDSEDELEISLAQIQQVLRKIEEATGEKPAVIYATFYPPEISLNGRQASILPQPDDQLELIAVTAHGEPVRQRVEGADRTKVKQIASRFADTIFYELSKEEYLPPSQQLYQWLIEPLTKDLQAREIDNLVFILESGMRSIPFAALHDGEKYLVEKYSVGMMPSFRLTNKIYQDIRDVELLAMGSDTFNDPELSPLPAVPVELDIVAQNLWAGKSLLNEDFTIDNLKQTQNKQPFGILHLATHAEFLPGKPSNSYIQFGDRKLRLNEIRELELNNPLVELIVLSACNTAVGDRDAEYGFASLAYQAGVKSALGSLWYVSDSGTLALMSTFYRELKDSPIKAEALRRAQVAMIKEKVRLEDGKLIGEDFEFDLPAEISAEELTHPRYWSPFAIIGNPW